MLLNIANAYEMLHFSESKADALNEVIGVLLRHTQRLLLLLLLSSLPAFP